tara:strand:+ start:6940 stop:7602 length:663 start_codon:yes stop_codon:yes gene_type:complete
VNITEAELKTIIDEEIEAMIDEGVLDRLKAKGAGAMSGLAGKAAGKLGFTGAASDAAAASKNKQVASLMNSYANHLLKLKQKLEDDGAALGIDDAANFKQISNAIVQTRVMAAQLAKSPQTAVPAAAATPAAAEPAAAPAAQSQADKDLGRTDTTGMSPEAAAVIKKGEDKELARQKALRSAPTPGAASKATPRIGTQIKEGETLNEQLQEISERWGFNQ